MRFAIWLGMEQTWDDLLGSAEHAERTGWDGIWVADHFMADGERSATPRLEAWTTIAGVAACVDRVRVGVLVTGNTYRHPAVLANMAATVDHLSDGRLVLGLGAGWQVNEHEAYGIELPAPPERLARLDEACQVIRLLHSQERSNFEGRFYQLVDAPCEPKPIQRPLPLLIGGSGEKVSMRIAARYADEWNCWGLPDLMAHKAEVLERHCLEIGRDPASIKRSAQALILMSDDEDQLRRWRADRLQVPHIVGTPREIAEVMARYAKIGLDEFVVSDRTLGRETSERRDRMDQFLDEVAIHLPGRSTP
ncbi:MAG TPA: TIGR03560 family F420-dependent LLM class oxidoreductase [Acidimicrobiales bacterium]|nr:TIGR03560 family F420-dependent LLM class oxidoreductase [Acidimicrobiales bacterium]